MTLHAPMTADLELPVAFGPVPVATHTLTRADRLMNEAERIAQDDPERGEVLAVRAMRAALVAVLIARGVHVVDGADATLARTVLALGLPGGAVRAFTDVADEVGERHVVSDASVALAGGRVVVAAAAALVAGDRPA